MALVKIIDSSGTGGPGGSDVAYVHNQAVPAATWTITHGLGKFPSVTVVDSANDVVYPDVSYPNNAVVYLSFSGSTGGKAFLN